MFVTGDKTLLAWIYFSIGVGAFRFITGAAVGGIFSTFADSTDTVVVLDKTLSVIFSFFAFRTDATFCLPADVVGVSTTATFEIGEAKCWAIKTVG